jgi:hydroxymethylpyrimidine/phosphomethylpyrimidine kinase
VETAKEACLAISQFGSKAILVKGGHFIDSKGTDVLYFDNEFIKFSGQVFPGHVRGTGCTYSSLIAGYLAKGFDIPDAVKNAKADMKFFLQTRPALTDDQTEVWQALETAVAEIVHLLPPEMIAEVGCNIAFAMKVAKGPEGICSLDSRLIIKAGRVVTLGRPVFGRDSHVGRVVMAAMGHYPELRCAMNLRYSEQTINRAREAGLQVHQFDRTNEPSDTSSMSWGTDQALRQGRADLIFDRGSVGKEPMIRLLAEDPEDLISKLTLLVGKRS